MKQRIAHLVPTLFLMALAVLATWFLVPASAQVTNHRPASYSDGWSAAKAQDARLFCQNTRTSWRALCERVWSRPSFSWVVASGAKITDPAGPAQIADLLMDGNETSSTFGQGLQGADEDWQAAHPKH